MSAMNNKLLEHMRVFLLDMASRFEDTDGAGDEECWGRPPEDGDKERMERALALFDELDAVFNHGLERGEREEAMWWVIKGESEILLEKVRALLLPADSADRHVIVERVAEYDPTHMSCPVCEQGGDDDAPNLVALARGIR